MQLILQKVPFGIRCSLALLPERQSGLLAMLFRTSLLLFVARFVRHLKMDYIEPLALAC